MHATLSTGLPDTLPPFRRARLRRAPVDWPAVERDYRSGALSLRDMALKHGCSHSAIANHAGRNGWTRASSATPGHP